MGPPSRFTSANISTELIEHFAASQEETDTWRLLFDALLPMKLMSSEGKRDHPQQHVTLCPYYTEEWAAKGRNSTSTAF